MSQECDLTAIITGLSHNTVLLLKRHDTERDLIIIYYTMYGSDVTGWSFISQL